MTRQHTSPADTPPPERDVVALEQVLDHLVDVQHVPPQDIFVVTCQSMKTSALYKRKAVGKHLLDNHVAVRDPRFLRITTIRSAKGLKSPVVIIAELDGLQAMRASSPAHYCQYLYIATSRAKHHLVVLAPPEHAEPLQPALSPLSAASPSNAP